MVLIYPLKFLAYCYAIICYYTFFEKNLNLIIFMVYFFSADFWPDRIHRSLQSRIIVAVVCLPTRWRPRDLMPKRARCRIDFRFLLPLPRLPLSADVSSHVVSVKVAGQCEKKSNAPARREN